MRLYHFTSALHLPHILNECVLLPSESNIGSPTPSLSPCGEHYGPDVVWLTDQADAQSHGNDGAGVNKMAIRFTVEVNAQAWRDFATAHGINRHWYRILDTTGGFTSRHWYVSENPIQRKDWVEVKNMRTGELF